MIGKGVHPQDAGVVFAGFFPKKHLVRENACVKIAELKGVVLNRDEKRPSYELHQEKEEDIPSIEQQGGKVSMPEEERVGDREAEQRPAKELGSLVWRKPHEADDGEVGACESFRESISG